jgi:hypothetical protein
MKRSQRKYGDGQMAKDIKKVRKAYRRARPPQKTAIHDYWLAVYRLGRKWKRLKGDGEPIRAIAKRVLSSGVSSNPFRAIIDATIELPSTPTSSPKERTRLSRLKSKYGALLKFATENKVRAGEFLDFVKKHGGLNFRSKKKKA